MKVSLRTNPRALDRPPRPIKPAGRGRGPFIIWKKSCNHNLLIVSLQVVASCELIPAATPNLLSDRKPKTLADQPDSKKLNQWLFSYPPPQILKDNVPIPEVRLALQGVGKMMQEGRIDELSSEPIGSAEAGDLQIAQLMVAHAYGVSLSALLADTRSDRRVAEARQVAMYLGHVVLGMNLAAVGRGFSRDRTTVRHACRHIEELREDRERDRLFAWLESLLRQAIGLRFGQQAVQS